MDTRFQAYIAKLGAELEEAFREGGSPLPPGQTGELMIRSFLDESRKETFSEAGQERQRALTRITQDVVATLPGGSTDPAFITLVSTKYKEWLDQHRNEAE
jgi:hypothetical protein